jgi:7-cyano-7-deazaguanine synthase
MKAVVLLSGGLDSSTALYQAIVDGADEVMAVSIKYGSKHQERETDAASAVVFAAGTQFAEDVIVESRTVQLPKIFTGGHSALMGDVEMPMEVYRDYESGEGESITVVPFRNANLLAAATTIAEVLGYDRVYAGMHATDHGTWAYPDCTPEFLGAMANALYVGTLGRVRLVFPFIWMTKADVVTRAVLLDVPVGLTYSCYEGRDKHCGQCPTCLERIKAFQEAGYKDPASYEVPIPELEDLEDIL